MGSSDAAVRPVVTPEQVQAYRRDGFVVVHDVLDAAEVAALKRVTDEFVDGSREVREHTKIYDLEPGHSAAQPRVRRIKAPHAHHPVYAALIRHPRILAVLQALVHPSIRFDTSKLNLKSAGYGAAVEWHQDWPFYPHTNDDLAAVGVMIDDMEMVNGPLLCIPGSHRGPVFDHHDADGYFCGAMDPEKHEIDYGAAVPCTGRAGSISIHHVRTVHGSAVNTSNTARRLLLLQYRAADAWPLLARGQMGFDEWKALLLCGEDDPTSPRCADVPVRLPLPASLHQGSIYENQRTLKNSYFGTAEAPKALSPAQSTARD
jgi:ectoine hydroxylase-related dioxygenase (phytanoyl-CoA dioxygenase family)